jgi:hypothetical protein
MSETAPHALTPIPSTRKAMIMINLSQALPSAPVVTPPANQRVEQFFARIQRGRIILAIDATASRQPTWDTAAKLQDEMFKAVSGLDVQLVYYRGIDECVASRWVSDARSLVSIMTSVMCRSGHTQIGKVLAHVAKEHRARPVNALILISDACEESPADLYAKARDLNVPVFLFQEGDDASAAVVYAEIARLTGGAVARFDAAAAQRLADLLKAVAAYASGGLKALALQKTEAATLLLTQMKR